MVIGIFGESCSGKSTLAQSLQDAIGATIYTGRDYLRLARNEAAAQGHFRLLLKNAVTGENVIYVISERAHLSLLPEDAFRILVTASLAAIQSRFSARMGGKLPPPVAAMLERNHGSFDMEVHHIRIHTDDVSTADSLEQILAILR